MYIFYCEYTKLLLIERRCRCNLSKKERRCFCQSKAYWGYLMHEVDLLCRMSFALNTPFIALRVPFPVSFNFACACGS